MDNLGVLFMQRVFSGEWEFLHLCSKRKQPGSILEMLVQDVCNIEEDVADVMTYDRIEISKQK